MKYCMLGLMLPYLAFANHSIPEPWIVTPEKELIKVKTEKESLLGRGAMRRFSKSISQVMEDKRALLNNIQDKPGKRWQLSSIKSELALEPSGTLGVLSMKGEAAVELFWNKKVRRQNSLEIEDNTPTIFISPGISGKNLESEISPAVEMAIATGKVRPEYKNQLRATLVKKATQFNSLISGIGNRPLNRNWWFYQFQIEVKVTASGKVAPLTSVGVTTRFRFQWKKIQRKNGSITHSRVENAPEKPTEIQKFLNNMSRDLSAYDSMNFRNTSFDLRYIKVGIGVGLKGNIYLAKYKTDVVGSIFFKRDSLKVLPSNNINELDGEDYLYLQDRDSHANRELAKHLNVERVSELSEGQAMNNRNPLALYKMKRRSFQKALRKSARMAKFFAGAALRRPEKNWHLNVIGLEFELILSGGIGFATLRQKSVIEMYLVRRKG